MTRGLLLFVVGLMLVSGTVLARDAAFVDPGTSGNGDDSIKVEPKNDIDVGETGLNVAKRTTLFFVNQTRAAIKIEKVTANGDGNVTAEMTTDDCTKQGTIAPMSRCSVEASVTPTSPGAWSAEILLTHNGAGRIVKAKISGKTSGTASEKKDSGLSFSTKDTTPVNFGDIAVGDGKIVRSALMVNDSPEPITLYSIDVVEASNGLKRLDQGCAVDMELKSGESCPVTLMWAPLDHGQISTDLIIRHSGRLGFAVIPIRGSAKGSAADYRDPSDHHTSSASKGGERSSVPAPPSARDLERLASSDFVPVSGKTMGGLGGLNSLSSCAALRLIGTVGVRAVLLTTDGVTKVAGVGETVESGENTVKVLDVSAKSVEVAVDGKRKTLSIGVSPELVQKAQAQAKERSDQAKNKDGSGVSTAPTGSSK